MKDTLIRISIHREPYEKELTKTLKKLIDNDFTITKISSQINHMTKKLYYKIDGTKLYCKKT